MKRISGTSALFLASCAFLAQSALAQTFVFPGDTVNIPVPVANADEKGNPGGATISSIKLTISAQSGFVTGATDSATETLAPGETKTLTPSFVVDPAAADGSYTVTVKVVSSDTGIDPDPSDSASDIQVNFLVSTEGPSGGNSNGNGTALSTSPMTNDNCLVSSATSVAGMQSISVSGPSFGPVTTTFSCPTAAAVGPFCALSSGTYTITDTDCAEVENPSPNQVTVTTGAPFASITAVSPSTTKFSSFQPSAAQLAADSSVLTITSDPGVTNFGGSQATDWQWVCKELLATASGSSSGCQFVCPGMGNPCYIQYQFIGTGLVPTSFSVLNSTTVNAQFGLSASYYSVSTLLGVAIVHFTQTELALTPNSSLSGTIAVSGANQPRPAGSADGIANSTPTISHITVGPGTCTPADTILQQLVAQLLASVLPNHNPYCWQGSEVVFTSPVPMSFSFQGPSGVTIDTATLGIYGYDLSSGTWTRGMATGQSISISSTGFIVASGSFTRTGTYGVYFQGQDSSAPVTTFAIQGSSFNFDGAVFVSTDAYVVLTATDPVVNGFASTIASVTYRMDPISGSPFYIYSSSIPLPLGTHVFEYRSVDYAGNTEAVKTATFTVTAGTAFRTPNSAQVPGVLLNGFLGRGAKLEVESQAQNSLTLLISSVNRQGMVSVDNIGEVGIGVTPQANLNIGMSSIGMQLRSGNSTSAVTSNQIAFGYNGDSSMRHFLRTEHSTSTDGNKMDFLVWNTGAGSTTAVANLSVLSLQGIKAASGGSFHVQPVGEPDAEVEVSNGLSTGGGTMQRLQVVAPSSRRFKTDIKDLSEKDENRALSDVAALKHAKFRYKTRRKDGLLIEDPAQTLRTGLIYEEAPDSIRDGAEALSTTERLVNVEMALKASMRRIEELQARYERLKARRKP